MWQKLVVLCLGSHHGSQKQVELSAWQTVFGSSKGKAITTYSKSSTPQTRDWEHPSKACEIMRYGPGTCQTLMLFWPLLISLYYVAPKWCYVSPNAINRNGGKKVPCPWWNYCIPFGEDSWEAKQGSNLKQVNCSFFGLLTVGRGTGREEQSHTQQFSNVSPGSAVINHSWRYSGNWMLCRGRTRVNLIQDKHLTSYSISLSPYSQSRHRVNFFPHTC